MAQRSRSNGADSCECEQNSRIPQPVYEAKNFSVCRVACETSARPLTSSLEDRGKGDMAIGQDIGCCECGRTAWRCPGTDRFVESRPLQQRRSDGNRDPEGDACRGPASSAALESIQAVWSRSGSTSESTRAREQPPCGYELAVTRAPSLVDVREHLVTLCSRAEPTTRASRQPLGSAPREPRFESPEGRGPTCPRSRTFQTLYLLTPTNLPAPGCRHLTRHADHAQFRLGALKKWARTRALGCVSTPSGAS
jgi:hypothetical protein